MSENNSDSSTNALESWMKLRDMMMESWGKTMADVVSSDAYAQATGTMLDNYLTMSAPAQQAIERTMGPILAQLNMPSRTEVTSLAKRLTNIELRLDDLDAKLDAIRSSLQELTQTNGPTAG
ncbi:MAG TPA: poly(R)-hydroxyalkanoic acid synthase subunit PhaE [Anaerolineales bacterium]